MYIYICTCVQIPFPPCDCVPSAQPLSGGISRACPNGAGGPHTLGPNSECSSPSPGP